MIEFFNNHLSSIIAGLVPSLFVFIQGMSIVFKNLKVNKNFDNLQYSVKELINGKLDFKEVAMETTKFIKTVQDDFLDEFKGLVDELKVGLKRDIDALREKYESEMKEHIAIIHAKVRGDDDVSKI